MFELSNLEILGLAAGFFTAFCTIPQSIKIIRTKEAEAVSGYTFSMLLASYILWLIYGIIAGSISIVFWNVIAIIFGSTTLFLKYIIWKK